MNLFTATPSYIDRYIVVFGDLHAVGSRVSCVYPPEQHGINPRGWRVLLFEVEPTRMYHKVKERALTSEEAAHFERLIAAASALMSERKQAA